jgi:hypothetical protein
MIEQKGVRKPDKVVVVEETENRHATSCPVYMSVEYNYIYLKGI